MTSLVVENLLMGYGTKIISNLLNVEIPKGKITTIIGSK